MFKSFKYNPIEDVRFAILKNRFKHLSETERNLIDLVMESFGMYSGKTLEWITHSETPWKKAREGYMESEPSDIVIEKKEIQSYFQKVCMQYDMNCKEGIHSYIKSKVDVI